MQLDSNHSRKVTLAAVLFLMSLLLTTGTAWASFHLSYADAKPHHHQGINIDWTAHTIREAVVAPVVYRRASQPVRLPEATGSSKWDCIAKYESGSNWGSTSGSFEGGLQFLPSTWRMAGGTKYAPHAYQATKEQQIAIAESWLAKTSWGQWPNTSRMCGYR